MELPRVGKILQVSFHMVHFIPDFFLDKYKSCYSFFDLQHEIRKDLKGITDQASSCNLSLNNFLRNLLLLFFTEEILGHVVEVYTIGAKLLIVLNRTLTGFY